MTRLLRLGLWVVEKGRLKVGEGIMRLSLHRALSTATAQCGVGCIGRDGGTGRRGLRRCLVTHFLAIFHHVEGFLAADCGLADSYVPFGPTLGGRYQ